MGRRPRRAGTRQFDDDPLAGLAFDEGEFDARPRLEITDQRLRVRYRLRKAGWDIPLLSIVDVTYTSGPIQRLFGVGVLRVQTNFAPLPAFMLDVPAVKQLADEVLQLRGYAWEQYVRSASAQDAWQMRAAS